MRFLGKRAQNILARLKRIRALHKHHSFKKRININDSFGREATFKMEVDEDDDFYAPEEGAQASNEQTNPVHAPEPEVNPEQEDEDLEEGEEEDEAGSEGSDSVQAGDER